IELVGAGHRLDYLGGGRFGRRGGGFGGGGRGSGSGGGFGLLAAGSDGGGDGERQQQGADGVHGMAPEGGKEAAAQAMRQASSNGRRGERGKRLAGSPWPRLTRMLDRIVVPAKNASSTLALSKPVIGPQSRPS